MHKYFAKTLFLGKIVHHLPECHSTNDWLSQLLRQEAIGEGTVVWSDFQTKGRGQRGNAWVSEPGRNLLFSVLLKPVFLPLQQSYLLNLATGIGLLEAVGVFLPKEKLELKWPNDLYVNDQKLAGILIENNLAGNILESSVAGIGLNVNQQHFALPTATSMQLVGGQSFDRAEVLEEILFQVEKNYLRLKSGSYEQLRTAYHDKMRWRGEMHFFESASGVFEGEIVGVGAHGKLLIRVERSLQAFDVKEVKFLY